MLANQILNNGWIFCLGAVHSCAKILIMKRQEGFTVIELVIVFVILITLTVFFVIQRNDLEVAARDKARKVAVNAMYYDLTEVFHAQNNYYPETISRDTLKAVDPALFTDPDGFTLDANKCTYTNSKNEQSTDGDCNYHYVATDCNGEGHCQSFKLTSSMEAEAEYSKSSASN